MSLKERGSGDVEDIEPGRDDIVEEEYLADIEDYTGKFPFSEYDFRTPGVVGDNRKDLDDVAVAFPAGKYSEENLELAKHVLNSEAALLFPSSDFDIWYGKIPIDERPEWYDASETTESYRLSVNGEGARYILVDEDLTQNSL